MYKEQDGKENCRVSGLNLSLFWELLSVGDEEKRRLSSEALECKKKMHLRERDPLLSKGGTDRMEWNLES